MKSLKEIAFEILDAFKSRNQKRLRKLNDVILKDVSLNFSQQLYELAVLSYVLSKIVSKPRFLSKEKGSAIRKIEDDLRDMAHVLGKEEEPLILEKFSKIEDSVAQLEKTDARFIRDLMSKGKLKTAATMYAQGLSLGLASELTKIPKQDILEYAGRTMMFDRLKEEMTARHRLKTARRVLGGSE